MNKKIMNLALTLALFLSLSSTAISILAESTIKNVDIEENKQATHEEDIDATATPESTSTPVETGLPEGTGSPTFAPEGDGVDEEIEKEDVDVPSTEIPEETLESELETPTLTRTLMRSSVGIMKLDLADGYIKIGTVTKTDGTQVTGYVQSSDSLNMLPDNFIPFNGEYVISGTFGVKDGNYKYYPAIHVFGGTEDNPIEIVLDSVNIDATKIANNGSAILLGYGVNSIDDAQSNSYLNLKLKSGSNNILKAGNRSAAIELWYTANLKGNRITIDSENSGTSEGVLTVEGGENAAGIGSGTIISVDNFKNSIIINGGTINAQGGGFTNSGKRGTGAGIGGAQNDMVGHIEINGGNVSATGGDASAGIGTSYYGFSGKSEQLTNVVINGGEVKAQGGKNGSGIGLGFSDVTASKITMDIEINGGTIIAQGGELGPGIGTGSGSSKEISVSSIKITGGTVHATSDAWAAAIGTHYGAKSIINEIIITGGAEVYALCGSAGTAIGRAGQNPASVGPPVTKIQIDKSAKVTALAMGHYDLNDPSVLPDSWYQAIDLDSSINGDGFVLMGLFEEPFADDKTITFTNGTEIETMVLLAGFESFAITLPSSDWKILVDGIRYIATKDINDTPVDQYKLVYDNKVSTMNDYWYLKPGNIQEVIYHDNYSNPEIIKEYEVLEGKPLIIEKNDFVVSGGVFESWNTKSDGGGTKYEESQEVTTGINNQLDLYAMWKTLPTPPTPTAKPTTTPDVGRTCQDDGYPEGYYWSESAQACVIDKVIVVPSAKPTIRPTVAPTAKPTATPDENNSVVVVEKPNTQKPTAESTVDPNATNQGASDKIEMDTKGSWSLVTVMATLGTLILSIVLIVMKKEDEENENDKLVLYKRNKGMMWGAIALSIISVVIVVLTQSFTQPMVWLDSYSLLMVLIMIITVCLLYLGSRWKEVE